MLAARVEQRMKSRARQKWRDVTLDKESPIQAVCGKAARTVLCGGRDENRVPTATAARLHHAARWRGGVAARGARTAARAATTSTSPRPLGRVLRAAADKSNDTL